MPINNLSQKQLDSATAEQVINGLQSTLAILNPIGKSLTPDERKQFGSINERNKLIVSKALDYHLEQPGLQTPDVDWKVFDQSWQTRSMLMAIENLCNSIIEVASDTRILHDYDLYQMTLTDYSYTKYKAESTAAAGGFTTKLAELKQFFGNPNGNAPKAEPKPEDVEAA